jgi:adenylate cyclase
MSDNTRFRFDLTLEVTSWDDKSGILSVTFKPDPRRYEWKEIDGKRYLYDKLDNTAFPESVYLEMYKQLEGQPIYYQPPKITDAQTYFQSRVQAIEDMLNGQETVATFVDKSEDFLESLASDKLSFVIISLDIVESTKLATATDQKTYAQLISVILYELSEVVPKFNGHVLKYTGDGLIAYFPEPSFITKNDLAIDCALTLRGLIYKAINPLLKQRGFPNIDIRIGLDAGEAYIKTIGSPETKQHKDIIGAVVSLAAKIQSKADNGGIYLGDTVERNLYTTWRLICEPVDLGPKWDYSDLEGNIYRVHRVKLG